MGITRKCDRCKKYYIRNTKHQVPGKKYVKIEGMTLTDVTGNVIDWFCLCDNCITELKSFLAMEGKQ